MHTASAAGGANADGLHLRALHALPPAFQTHPSLPKARHGCRRLLAVRQAIDRTAAAGFGSGNSSSGPQRRGKSRSALRTESGKQKHHRIVDALSTTAKKAAENKLREEEVRAAHPESKHLRGGPAGNAASVFGGETDAECEVILNKLQAVGPDGLEALGEDHPASPYSLSMYFLCWLAAREAAAKGKEKKRLGALAVALVTLREGLRPHNTHQYAEAAALLDSSSDGANASGRIRELGMGSGGPSNSDSVASDAQADSKAGSLGGDGGGVGWGDGERGLALRQEGLEQLLGPASGGLSDRQAAQLAARRSALMLSPEGTALTAKKVDQLEEGVLRARAQSALQLLGRAPGSTAGFSAASATEQILDFLLSIEDDGERSALLPDAFTPAEQPPGPPPGTGAGASEAGPASPPAPAMQPQASAAAEAQDSADAAAEAGLETLVAAGAFDPSALGSSSVGDKSGGAEEVQLSTTALRLLNAVDARFSEVQKEFDALLPGVGDEAAATESFLRERRRLQRLRADVLRHTDL